KYTGFKACGEDTDSRSITSLLLLYKKKIGSSGEGLKQISGGDRSAD
ncbi:hypothetical protein MIMGU_mgv1a0207572mg, partial [Erythranthe guttata]